MEDMDEWYYLVSDDFLAPMSHGATDAAIKARKHNLRHRTILAVKHPGWRRSLKQLIDEPPITLGRPSRSFRAGKKLLDAIVPRFLELFRRCLIVAILRNDLRANPCPWHLDHRERALDQSLLNHHLLAHPHLAGGFRRLAVHGNTASAAGVRGKRPRPENADGPEPFVHAFSFEGRVHLA
jgi:hypothetical protein